MKYLIKYNEAIFNSVKKRLDEYSNNLIKYLNDNINKSLITGKFEFQTIENYINLVCCTHKGKININLYEEKNNFTIYYGGTSYGFYHKNDFSGILVAIEKMINDYTSAISNRDKFFDVLTPEDVDEYLIHLSDLVGEFN